MRKKGPAAWRIVNSDSNAMKVKAEIARGARKLRHAIPTRGHFAEVIGKQFDSRIDALETA